jgi:glutaminase
MRLPLEAYLADLHARTKGNSAGAVATYIPELARADPDRFGIAVVALDGYAYAVGDADLPFTIQSVSKPFVYAAALESRGREAVLSKVGVEPSGDAFNSISLDPQTGAPVNPMINAGAIAVTALIPGADAASQWTHIHDSLSAFAGRPLGIDETVYRSESETGYRNRAIAWMLRNFGIAENDPMPALENYFRQCSVEVTCRDLAFMAATLANGGINPRTGRRVISPSVVEAVLSVMATCGMYDYAGSWLYEAGMPAKSGVSGAIIAVLPGRFGIAVQSPLLDSSGNSVRGIEVCRELSRNFGLHVFGPVQSAQVVLNRVYSGADIPVRRGRSSAQRAVIEKHVARIRYLELQGEVGVDSVEYVARRIDLLMQEARYFILDLHRVTSIGASAGRMLAEVGNVIAQSGGVLLLSQLRARRVLLRDIEAHCGELARFDDNELAMEWCEERILDAATGAGPRLVDASATSFPVFAGLDAAALLRLGSILKERNVAAGDVLISAGEETNDRVFLILSGVASVRLPLHNGDEQRVAKLSAGAVFGETALLGLPERTASVRAETELSCMYFTADDFNRITEEHPGIRIRVLKNLATELASKLTQSNQLIRALAG